MSFLEFSPTRERGSLNTRCRVLQEALNTKASQMTKRILTHLVITIIHLDQYLTPDIRSHRFTYTDTLLRVRVQEHRTPKSFLQRVMMILGDRWHPQWHRCCRSLLCKRGELRCRGTYHASSSVSVRMACRRFFDIFLSVWS